MNWNLIRLRKEKGLTQEDMAKKMDVYINTYRNKEAGRTEFKAKEMFFLSEFFGKSIEEIFLDQ